MKKKILKFSFYRRGFTLIELLIVVIILSALAVLVLVALNPLKRAQSARDARRSVDVSTILTAIHLSTIDGTGSLPSGLSTGMAERQLGTATSGCTISSGGCNVTNDTCLDMRSALSKTLESIPIDPTNGNITKTGYTVTVDANNIVKVRACYVENAANIYQAR